MSIDSDVHSNHQNNKLSRGRGGNVLFKFTSYSSVLHFHKSATGTSNIFHSEFAYGKHQYKILCPQNPFDCGSGLGIYVESGYSWLEFYVTIYNHSMCKSTALVNRLSFNWYATDWFPRLFTLIIVFFWRKQHQQGFYTADWLLYQIW